MSRWYRAYEGTVTDAKLAEATLVSGCSRSVAIAAWHCLLESAASKNNCGSYDATARRVAAILCEPLACIEALLAAFDELGLTDAGTISSWRKRQYHSDDSKERVAKHREKKRQETLDNDEGNATVTTCNGDVTPPETEADTEASVSNETLPAVRVEHVVEAWNAIAVPSGAVKAVRTSPKRRQKMNTFLRNYTIEEITTAIHAVRRSDFLCGKSRNSSFRADISFLFSEDHMNRLLEGFYDR